MNIDFILNDLIENSFDNKYIKKRLSKKDALTFISKSNWSEENIIEKAKERYIDRLIHEQYIFSLS